MADNEPANPGKNAGKLVAIWRTAQVLDSSAWKKLQRSAPLRLTRWLIATALVSIRWDLSGTPHSAVAWLPVLVLVGLLLLPDADAIGFGNFSWKAKQDADRAEAAKEEVQRVVVSIDVGRELGKAEGEVAQVRGTPQPAADAVRRYLP